MNFYIYKDRIGEWRWYLKASNGLKIADSAEGYKAKESCLAGIALVKAANMAQVYEI